MQEYIDARERLSYLRSHQLNRLMLPVEGDMVSADETSSKTYSIEKDMKHKEDHLRDLATISKIKHSIEDINLQDQCSRPEYEKNTEVIRERQCVDDAKERENEIAQRINECEADLEQSVRTAGLRKRRENSLIEEIRTLRTLRTNFVVAIRESQAASESTLRNEFTLKAKRQASKKAADCLAIAQEYGSRCKLATIRRLERCHKLETKKALHAAKSKDIRWKEEFEYTVRTEMSDVIEQIRHAADERVIRAEKHFDDRVREVRRGAEARITLLSENVAALKRELDNALHFEQKAAEEAIAATAAASRVPELEKRVKDLEGRLEKKALDENIQDTHASIRAMKVEAELRATKAREKELEHKFNEAASQNAQRREKELCDLDDRIRRVFASKQEVIDRLRREKEEAQQTREETLHLLQQLENRLNESQSGGKSQDALG